MTGLVRMPVYRQLTAGAGGTGGTGWSQVTGTSTTISSTKGSPWQQVTSTKRSTVPIANPYTNSINVWVQDAGSITANYLDISPASLLTMLTHLKQLKVPLGNAFSLQMPDGGVIEVKADGTYQVVDNDAKVTYRACNIRDFNPFLNASDKLEDFIRYCGSLGVKQQEMLKLPMELFIAWLVLEAAKYDNEPEPEDIKLIPNLRKVSKPRCIQCQRFLPLTAARRQIHFCRTLCFERYSRAGGLVTA